mmetsp:Transcript_114100/g.227034  ORF Transcript_114100/g.227034 Transcript_114100/m.227034 type:complete len:87 (+) Transcript_114100:187-447(+)
MHLATDAAAETPVLYRGSHASEAVMPPKGLVVNSKSAHPQLPQLNPAKSLNGACAQVIPEHGAAAFRAGSNSSTSSRGGNSSNTTP